MTMKRNRFDSEETWITKAIYAIWIVAFVIGIVFTVVVVHFIRKFW